MNISPILLLLILASFIIQSNEAVKAKKSKKRTDFNDDLELGIKIGWTIIKLPIDIAKLLVWKAVRLRQDISKTVGVKAIVSSLKFVTPKCVQKKYGQMRNKIREREYNFILGEFKYTIAIRHHDVEAYKSKIIRPTLKSKLKEKTSKFFHSSKAKISNPFRASKKKLSTTFSKSNLTKKFQETKTKIKNLLRKIRIPDRFKSYFRKLEKKNKETEIKK